MSDDTGVGAFFVGLVTAFLIVWAVLLYTKPTLEEHELYRFCLIKNIPLEECLIPFRPYKLTPKQTVK